MVAVGGGDVQIPQDRGHDGFTEQASELNSVIEGNAFHPEKALIFFIMADFDQVTPLVGLMRLRGTIAFVADPHILNLKVAPPHGCRHVDALWERFLHPPQISRIHGQMDLLDGLGRVKVIESERHFGMGCQRRKAESDA